MRQGVQQLLERVCVYNKTCFLLGAISLSLFFACVSRNKQNKRTGNTCYCCYCCCCCFVITLFIVFFCVYVFKKIDDLICCYITKTFLHCCSGTPKLSWALSQREKRGKLERNFSDCETFCLAITRLYTRIYGMFFPFFTFLCRIRNEFQSQKKKTKKKEFELFDKIDLAGLVRR